MGGCRWVGVGFPSDSTAKKSGGKAREKKHENGRLGKMRGESRKKAKKRIRFASSEGKKANAEKRENQNVLL